MSKLGLLTFYNEINYGAQLQAYALQSSINALGHESEFIRYIGKRNTCGNEKKGLISYVKIFKRLRFSISNYVAVRNIRIETEHLFEDFVERNMMVSRKSYNSLQDLKEDEHKYDGFVTGSDMVWSDIGQDLDVYFLTFTNPSKRLSYAPSITGRDSETDSERKNYIEWITGIRKLSCREQYGVEYIQRLTGMTAELVVDPTLLLNSKEWTERLGIEKKDTRPYILCYMFNNESRNIKSVLSSIAEKNNMDIIYIPMCIEEILYDIKNNISPIYGPKDFVELFYNATYVITNSFHGLLFSVIMNVPFYLLHREKKNKWYAHEERMKSILKQIELGDRFINPSEFNENIDFNLDYNEVNKRIDILREKSLTYLKETLDCLKEDIDNYCKIQEKKYHRVDELGKGCTGCGMCSNICPTKAIHMIENKEGFLYPNIVENNCENCGACVSICPQINRDSLNVTKEAYCGYGLDEIVMHSASGGVFATIAKYIIEIKQGVVIGAALDLQSGECQHIAIEEINDLRRLQNSKYVQSTISKVLPICLEKLEQGRVVLFSGTPCQIAGLKKYLKKQYSNLLTVDIICHGVPSPRFFKTYLENELPYNNMAELTFRYRSPLDKGRSLYGFSYRLKSSAKKFYLPGDNNTFYTPFTKAENLRESCYDCYYAQENRTADITLGDCDSWKLYDKFKENNVLSSILLNTTKGVDAWNECKSLLRYTKLDYKEETLFNHQLRRSVDRPNRRDSFYEDLYKMPWKKFKRTTYSGKNSYITSVKRAIILYFENKRE